MMDVDVPSYGPGGADCLRGNRVDGIPFDRSFRCDCYGTAFSGDLCQSAVATSSASSDEDTSTTAALIAVFATILVVLITVVAVQRLQLYRANRKPENLTPLQVDMLSGMGMASPLDIADDE